MFSLLPKNIHYFAIYPFPAFLFLIVGCLREPELNLRNAGNTEKAEFNEGAMVLKMDEDG